MINLQATFYDIAATSPAVLDNMIVLRVRDTDNDGVVTVMDVVFKHDCGEELVATVRRNSADKWPTGIQNIDRESGGGYWMPRHAADVIIMEMIRREGDRRRRAGIVADTSFASLAER
jgi:hypothetical protein